MFCGFTYNDSRTLFFSLYVKVNVEVIFKISRGNCMVFASNGSWRSIWKIEFKDDLQAIEIEGKLQVI